MWRVAQEALANVERHAEANAVRIVWRCDGQRALIDVTDNGVGFEQGRAGRLDSYGVLGMRERAASIGASLEILSAPGRGTRVRCVLDPEAAEPSSKNGAAHRGAAEDVVQQREDPGQHVGGAIVRDVIPGQGDRSQMAVRVDPGGRGPDPRLGDLGAHVGRVARGGHAASVNHPAFNAALEDFPRSGGRSDGSRCSDVATNLGVALARYLGRWKNGVLR